MSQPKQLIVVVDRVEVGKASLEADDGRRFERPAKSFAFPLSEGAVLRVDLDSAGRLQWKTAVRDLGEESRRRGELGERMDRLRGADGGGDIKL
jgi:hypothetical protein